MCLNLCITVLKLVLHFGFSTECLRERDSLVSKSPANPVIWTPLMALRTPLKSLAFYLKTATLSNHFMKRMENAGFPKEKKSSANMKQLLFILSIFWNASS